MAVLANATESPVYGIHDTYLLLYGSL